MNYIYRILPLTLSITAILSFVLNTNAATLYSMNVNGDWTSGSTWSYTLGGLSCSCIPRGGDNAIIRASDVVVVSTNHTISGSLLTIDVFGTLVFDVGKLTLPAGSVVTLEAGGKFDKVGSGGGSSSRLTIGTKEVWNTVDDDQSGPLTFADAPLPVVLLYFNAAYQNGNIKLEWATAQELNNDRFEVEKSTDGVFFFLIKTISGKGTTSVTTTYRTEDSEAQANFIYYKLNQIDIDGRIQVFKIKVVNLKNSEAGIFVFPNSIKNNSPIFIQLASNNGEHESRIEIANQLGEKVYSMVYDNGNSFAIKPQERLKPGLYFVEVTNNKKKFQQKIFIK